MNGETRKIVRVALIVGLAAGAAACVASPFTAAQVDPSSPIAARATAAAKAKAPRRKFSDIPVIPGDVPNADQVRAAVVDQQRAGDALTKAVAPGTWALKDTEGYADKARRDVKPGNVFLLRRRRIRRSAGAASRTRPMRSPLGSLRSSARMMWGSGSSVRTSFPSEVIRAEKRKADPPFREARAEG